MNFFFVFDAPASAAMKLAPDFALASKIRCQAKAMSALETVQAHRHSFIDGLY
ncbi:hypothetical protein ACO0K0_17170 [Undibacterium sp. SXout11W]|uniref:hypothetical protein n=1 Tax=Undibacterium sp. SXout11W TaxID=3413050 RepID=UPI003BF3855C